MKTTGLGDRKRTEPLSEKAIKPFERIKWDEADWSLLYGAVRGVILQIAKRHKVKL